jgi:4-amino-4-deoxy-L-arabinose transferase-like glycosyltransferase
VSWSLASLCLALSLFVQSQILTRAPFHEDEAFYTAYSKDILHGRPLLTSEGVEKPLFSFYWQALFMAIGGEGQAAARLPNVAAVVIAIGFAFFMARRIYDGFTAGAIAMVLALSPFYVLFGPTAFTDVIAATLAIGSLERLSARKWFGSGVLAAGSMFSNNITASSSAMTSSRWR